MGSPNPISHDKPKLSIIQHMLIRRGLVAFITTLTLGTIGLFWWAQDFVPITMRRRFIFFSQEFELSLGNSEFQRLQEENEAFLVPRNDSRVYMVHRILRRLLTTCNNPLMKQLHWEVIVIESNEVNAMVLPGGKVIVYTGIFDAAPTEELLAAVLAHEIGHVIARHGAEAIGEQAALTAATMILRWFCGIKIPKFSGDVLVSLPHSRRSESEADYIGLLLMIRANYNPEKAVLLWHRMNALQSGEQIPLLSTHPSNEQRMKNITDAIPILKEFDRELLRHADSLDVSSSLPSVQ